MDTPVPRAPLRVGTVPYLVGRPLDLGLEREPGVALVRAVPAELAALLARGELDVALVSSIEHFRLPGSSFVPGLAVAGRGPVSSVKLFLRRPLDEARTIALDPASRSAAVLARIVLTARGLRGLAFLEMPAGQDPRAAPADAWLRIGDQALREQLVHAAPSFDPSEAWRELTGLLFPFALWLARPGLELAPHRALFERARERGARALPALAAEAARLWQLPEPAVRHYLAAECVFEPGDELEPALAEFGRRAAELDLVPRAVARA
jgi:chorismate dehydratase